MTPALRTAILDALMEKWQEDATYPARLQEPMQREYLSTCLDMILPIAEPMIRETALREAAAVVSNDAIFYSDPNEIDRAERLETDILALGEPK